MSRKGFSKNLLRFDTRNVTVDRIVGDIESETITTNTVVTNNIEIVLHEHL